MKSGRAESAGGSKRELPITRRSCPEGGEGPSAPPRPHLAVWNNHKACVLFLLSINVDKNAQDKGGYTPLYFAVYRGYENIVLILMEHHSDCTIPSYMQVWPCVRSYVCRVCRDHV